MKKTIFILLAVFACAFMNAQEKGMMPAKTMSPEMEMVETLSEKVNLTGEQKKAALMIYKDLLAKKDSYSSFEGDSSVKAITEAERVAKKKISGLLTEEQRNKLSALNKKAGF